MEAARLGDDLALAVPWRTGDVARVDHFAVLHGWWEFTGTRRLLASLIA